LPLGTEGVLDSALPQALPPTLYSRLGDVPLGLLLAAIVLVAAARRMRQ
jgi:apolipoprotein N-acyltransferase